MTHGRIAPKPKRDGEGMVAATEATELSAEHVESMLPEGLIRDDEVVILLLRPSLLFVPLSSMGFLATVAVITLGLALLAVRVTGIPWTDTQVYALGLAVASARLIWQTLEWWSRVYVLTDRRVLRRAGVLRVVVFEAQLKNIQHTSVFMMLRERVFAIGTIGFATAGSDVFDAFWTMVRQPFAVHKAVVDAMQRYG